MPVSELRAGFKKWVQGENPMKTTLRTGLAELIGTFILVFLGCMGCVSGLGVIPSHLQITLNFGLAVMIAIQCTGHISQAHVNPAITVGSVVLGEKTLSEALIYIVSQIIGAILGFGTLKMVTPRKNLVNNLTDQEDLFCITDVNRSASAIQGLIIEGIATGILMLVVCSVWDIRNEKNSDSVPIKLGLAVTALATTVGPYTGCSMNPARSFAPALWNNHWARHWIYWFGPIGGALVTSFIYKTIFGLVANEDEEEPVPEAIALNSVEGHKTEQS